MRTPPAQPTTRELQELIPEAEKTIGQYDAKGWSEPAALQQAKTDLQTAQRALDAGDHATA